jgi:diguanylate cyclase (GGDEF)-like protein
MNESIPSSSENVASEKPELFRERLRKLDRKQWWLWSTTVLILVLLTVAVASFAFPALLSREESTYSFYLNQSVRALVGIVLLFTVYLVYQQSQILRMRGQIAEQIESLARVQTLTAEVYKLAALDQLTGLYNRRSGEQRLAEEISRSLRYGRPLTLLMLDLDGLKQTNDVLGHAGGDLVLKAFSERLQRAIRGSDLAVRLGGDEFMVMLPECRAEEVHHVLLRLEGASVTYEGHHVPCRFSRGWVDYRAGETALEFMKRADDVLYSNKRSRKNKAQRLQADVASQPAV